MEPASTPTGDLVLFEIPTRDAASDLFHQLDRDRAAWTYELRDVSVVGTEFRAADDLAVLLREVEGWVADQGLGAIRFWLDERDYVLHAGEVIWSGLAQ